MRRITAIMATLVGLTIFGIGLQGQDHDSLLQALDCLECHTCENPTPENMCLRACPTLRMAHQTGEHGLVEAPESMLLGELADLYKPVRFNHKLHAQMAEMGGDCATCHHYSPPGEIPPCRECHDREGQTYNLRQPGLKGAYHRQCLSCHREWSHDTRCVVCHIPQEGKVMEHSVDSTDIIGISHPVITEPDTKVYRTPYEDGPIVTFHHKEHIELFGLKCANCHQNENCGYCHDLDQTVKVAKTMEEVHAICNDCHASQACSKCHDTQKRPGFTHASTGWPLNEYHGTLECRACHPTGKPISALNNECTNCHAGWNQENFDHAVTGLQLDEMHQMLECSDCHINLDYTRTSGCSDCHDEGMSPQENPPGDFVHTR